MILAVDVGNTTVHFCSIERSGSGFSFRNSQKYPTEGVSFPYFQDCGQDPRQFEGAVLCSVVPGKNQTLIRMLEKEMGTSPLVVSSDLDSGLKLCIKKPEKLGADRLADACGAAHSYPLPLLTVDIGTAITFNAVDEKGRFLGGAIAPGLDTAMQSLENKTAQLFSEVLETPSRVIGTDTEECLQSGVIFGAASLIEGMAGRMERELGKTPTLVLTGGGASYLDSLISREHVTDPYLLMRGLSELYQKNQENSHHG